MACLRDPIFSRQKNADKNQISLGDAALDFLIDAYDHEQVPDRNCYNVTKSFIMVYNAAIGQIH